MWGLAGMGVGYQFCEHCGHGDLGVGLAWVLEINSVSIVATVIWDTSLIECQTRV